MRETVMKDHTQRKKYLGWPTLTSARMQQAGKLLTPEPGLIGRDWRTHDRPSWNHPSWCPRCVAAVLGFKIGWLLVEAPMPIKAFTFYSLARDLENTAPGFGITIDYEILESLMVQIV